ncbi:unnamed protein product [Effrenium voratum]|uniref:Uncharacterized protein n=1 Tax=Effrenium voratum TaxID=2562239 RepID=A0AA36JBH7_9DINO|nr:unnamed protein product [Effrenium voratum]
MVKWWQVGGTSNADLEDAAEVAKALQPAEATWREDDLPFFDSRLIVETSAQFIAASFRIRAGADAKHESRQEEAKEGREGSGTPISRGPAAGDGQFRLRHAACCHAHHFTGLERLTTQLVPRCRPFAGQLQQTLRSICMQRGQDLEALLDSEVERFLKSRLVVMRLTDVMTPDLVAKIDSETESEDEAYGVEGSGIFNATAKGLRSKGDLGGRRGPSIHPLGQPIKLSRHALAKKLQQMSLHAITGASVGRAAGGVAEAARRAVKEERRQRAKEKGMRLFEHRFFRAFTIALGQSLFGEREDLVFRFEVAALNVLHTYQGELPLALHSLMGWLPAQVSKSLFVVLTGLPALVAAKQSLEKFGMLLNCVNCIASGSGRYVFVSTPSWYLPLSARLFRRLGRLHEIRETSLATGGRPITSVQAVWPSPAEPQEVIAAVDAIWGGRIAGQRAALGLCGGVEAMGEWVLRMTMGCQGLLMRALEVLQSFAPSFEQAYDELVAEGEFANLEVPSDPSLARCLADCAAEAVRLRAHAARQAAKSLRAERLAECDDALPSRRPKAKFRKSVTETVPSGGRERRTSLADVESDATEVGRRRPGERPNLLAQLQRGDIVRDEAAQHLRRSVKVGVGSGVRLPVGSGHMVGRIPIHDSPKLRPDVAAPIVEEM